MTYIEFHRWILAAVLALVRISAACAICPVLTESMIPGLVRRVVGLGFAFIVIPLVHSEMPPGEPNVWMFGVSALKEALVGFLLGFFASIPFWVAENVGNFIDNQRGATMGEVYSPLSGAQVSTTGIFFTQVVSTIFFTSGAVFVFLAALYTSYSIWPVFPEAVAGAPRLFGVSFTPGAPLEALGSVDGMLKATVVISAPVIIIMFLATLGLGFVNRTAPQLNVFFLSMPVKSALGVAMLIIYLPFIMDMLMYTREGAILDPVRRMLSG